MRPSPPDIHAPRDVESLPAYWDRRRQLQGKPDASTCAADLRQALDAYPMRAPLVEALVMCVGLAIAIATGVRLFTAPPPPAVMHCLCPEATR